MSERDVKETKVKRFAREIKDLIGELQGLKRAFSDFIPEISAVEFDYLVKSMDVRLLLNLPRGIVRKFGTKIAIPAYSGFSVRSILDLDTGAPVNLKFEQDSNRWILPVKDMPDSQRYSIAMRGDVSREFLDNWVKITAPLNPKCEGNIDRYWLHATIVDSSVLQEIYDVLSIDNVVLGVNVGVERIFSSAVPKRLRDRLSAHRDFVISSRSGARNVWIKKAQKYRKALRKSGPEVLEFLDFVFSLVSGEYFREFIRIDDPFQLNRIEANRQVQFVPEQVLVEVYSKLTLETPVASGNLIFERVNFDREIKRKVDEEFRDVKF